MSAAVELTMASARGRAPRRALDDNAAHHRTATASAMRGSSIGGVDTAFALAGGD